ncbi:MAG TPA: MiaB/RimO family radical SAM methylthiotransferase [Gemmatimonadales bacterium]|nr:MiaB/RimO family radical SAM methylthiotransferase [Gemmatimonadales bacterium]
MNVFLHTFGCRANQYDTEVVRQAFVDQGATIVATPDSADIAVVNSCTVTEESEAKMRRYIRRLARAGRGNLATVVMGCAAALDDGSIAGLPSVTRVVRGADPAAVLDAAGLEGARVSPVLRRFVTHARAWLKIQDGCDEHCTFCATTLARGANRSRPVADLIREARALGEHHAEIVLTGVHIGTYGRDREEGRGEGEGGIGALVEALVNAVPSVRFRLSSIEATEIDDRLARMMIETPGHLAPHVHAPLQSGSDPVLRRMGRHWYSAGSYRARIEFLAEWMPVFGLGADIIAGFPGESEDDHRATVEIVRTLPFTYLHVFPFSARPDAPATRLGDALPPAVVRERAAELRELGEARAHAYRLAQRGRVADGVAGGHGGGCVEALTEDYLSVPVPLDAWDGKRRFPVTIL